MAEERKNSISEYLKLIGILLLFIGLLFIIYDAYSNRNLDIQEEKALNNFYIQEQYIRQDNEQITESTENLQEIKEVKQKTKIEYIAVLKIPKIDLERGLVDPNNYLNNVDYNIEILDDSSMPDEKNGNLILASHSGNSRESYFRNLDKLELDDNVSIDYKGKTYNYTVVSIYEIEKTGTAKIVRNKNKSTLTLITCKRNTNKQIVVICELEE